MRKALTVVVSLITIVVPFSFAAASANLWEFYVSQGQDLPPVSARAVLYGDAGFQDTYTGTAFQNQGLLDFLQYGGNLGSLAFPPSTVEGTSTAGWTDDGSIVRLNTGSDFVGIGTNNPAEKLVVSGNIYGIGADITITGGDFTLGSSNGTSTLTANTSGVGLGTTSPTAPWSVHGNSYTAGTTTTGSLNVASSSSTFRDVWYEFPPDDGDAGEVLQTNGGGRLTWVATTSSAINFTTTEVFSGSAPNISYSSLALGGTVGSNQALVYLKITGVGTGSGTSTYSFRKGGETPNGGIGSTAFFDTGAGTTILNGGAGEKGYVFIPTSSTGTVEWLCVGTCTGTTVVNLEAYLK